MPLDPTHLRRSPVAKAIRERRLIVVLRRIQPRSRLLELVDELAVDGARIFEITLDSDEAADDLAAVRERLARQPWQDVATWVGAGTTRTPEQLHAAREAGATFAVSPVLDRTILDAALVAGLPFVPGVYSPTEADVAWRAGATFVKLFPGSSLGPHHVRELRGPLPEIETIVTGGVDGTSAAAFLAAGAVAVGIGSAMDRLGGEARRALIASLSDPR